MLQRGLALCLLLLVRTASGRTAEIVLSLGVSSDLLPTLVCVQSPKVRGYPPSTAQEFTTLLAASSTRNTGVLMKPFSPPCQTAPSACDRCTMPSTNVGGVVCMVTGDPVSRDQYGVDQRDLQLRLENAGIAGMEMHGADIVLFVDLAEGAPPRVTTVGGGYQRGLAQTVPASGTLELPLRNRCVVRPLLYPSSGTLAPNVGKPELSVEVPAPSANLWIRERADGADAVVVVPEIGKTAIVHLMERHTTYVGSFSYPADDSIKLLATRFRFTWQKNAFVTGRRSGLERLWSGDPNAKEKRALASRDECPDVSLPRSSVATCKLQPNEDDDAPCTYECVTPRATELPTVVEFRLRPPARLSQETIVWDDEVKYPDDVLVSFQKLEDRRIYLGWPHERQDALGREWDAVELVGADGKMHRLAQKTSDIPEPGLSSPANFSYHYSGRGPHKTRPLGADGDLLLLPEPSESRQQIVLSFQGHTGLLYRPDSGADEHWSPIADLDIAARVGVHWEFSLLGAFTANPSSVQHVDDQTPRWQASEQVRVALLAGYRIQQSRGQYWTFNLGGGFTTNALASDWSKSKPFPVALAQAHYGYEFTESLAFEPYLEFWAPERYIQNREDAAGPLNPTSRYDVSVSLGVGIQWEDAL